MEGTKRPRRPTTSWEELLVAAQLPSIPIAFSALAASTLLVGGRCIVTGYNVINNGTASSLFNLHNGQDASGPLIAQASPAAGARSTNSFGSVGVYCDLGLFLETGAGPFTGSVLVVVMDEVLGQHWPGG